MNTGEEFCSRCNGRAASTASGEEITAQEDVAADESSEETSTEAEHEHVEYNGPMAKYRVIGEIHPLNEDGSQKEETLEMDSIHELPTAAGDQMVEEGTMERVEDEKPEVAEDKPAKAKKPAGKKGKASKK